MQAKTKKILVASSIIGAIAILATAMVIRNKRKKLEAKITAGSPDVIEPAKATTTSVLFPLKRGSGKNTAEKNAVRVVQRYINAKSVIHWWLQVGSLEEDGLFGSLTESALLKLAGVKEVSYTMYKEMQNYLAPAPDLLSPNAAPYKMTDPSVVKNDLSLFQNINPLNLFQ